MRATRFSVRGTIKKTVLGLLVLGEATFGVPLLAQVTAPKHTIDSRVVLVVGHKNPDTDAILSALGPGPTESPSQVSWCGHAGAGFVGTAPVRWPTPLPLLI